MELDLAMRFRKDLLANYNHWQSYTRTHRHLLQKLLEVGKCYERKFEDFPFSVVSLNSLWIGARIRLFVQVFEG